MSDGENLTVMDGASAPAPLVMSKLRNHFRQTYMLNESQVEIMLMSSSRSLEQALSSAREILKEKEPAHGLAGFFHGLKGLLLNMGEAEWASFTKAVEDRLAVGEQIDYVRVLGIIEKGLADILSYGGENVIMPGSTQKENPEQSK